MVVLGEDTLDGDGMVVLGTGSEVAVVVSNVVVNSEGVCFE